MIDALYGSGFHGSLPTDSVPWTTTDAPVLSVDVPSGLDAASGVVEGHCFHATRTVAFHAYKVGHFVGEGPDRCGTVEVADIGLTEGRDDDTAAEFLLCEEADAPRPRRSRTTHKWSAGSVLVVGGSPGLTGAAALAAQGAIQFGAGAVAIACPGGLQHVYESMAPGLMTVAAGDGMRFEAGDAASLLRQAERFDVLAIGPGLGPEQTKFLSAVLEGRSGPVVIDADGLNALEGPAQLRGRDGDTVLTPHHGEFSRLSGETPGYKAAQRLAAASGATVLLKGGPTFVAGTTTWVVDTGGPELATIGTGDVLTGMVAALIARGLTAEEAARSAAYWHGRAGAQLMATRSVTAEELAAEVGTVSW